MPEPMHIDDFIDDLETDSYASWFFNMKRLPAILKSKFAKWISQYQLYCIYEGQRYRVTGCSRMGDVWLTSNFAQDTGYELRVSIEDCSEFEPAA